MNITLPDVSATLDGKVTFAINKFHHAMIPTGMGKTAITVLWAVMHVENASNASPRVKMIAISQSVSVLMDGKKVTDIIYLAVHAFLKVLSMAVVIMGIVACQALVDKTMPASVMQDGVELAAMKHVMTLTSMENIVNTAHLALTFVVRMLNANSTLHGMIQRVEIAMYTFAFVTQVGPDPIGM